jgi:hypothetical protein
MSKADRAVFKVVFVKKHKWKQQKNERRSLLVLATASWRFL